VTVKSSSISYILKQLLLLVNSTFGSEFSDAFLDFNISLRIQSANKAKCPIKGGEK
jgi:hypothetical protein